MKRPIPILAICFALATCLSIASCGNSPPAPDIQGTIVAAVSQTHARETSDAQVQARFPPTSQPVVAPAPAFAPQPSQPVVAPAPAFAPQAASPSECITWQNAASVVGKNVCITGTVTRVFTDQKSGVTFIDFSSRDSDYTGFSPSIRWDSSLVGKCVKISGLVELYKGAPETIIKDKSQLATCN